MSDLSEESSSGRWVDRHKEPFSTDNVECENLLASPGDYIPRRERLGTQRRSILKHLLFALNIIFLIANALGWLFIAVKPSVWACRSRPWDDGKAAAGYSRPQILSPCEFTLWTGCP